MSTVLLVISIVYSVIFVIGFFLVRKKLKELYGEIHKLEDERDVLIRSNSDLMDEVKGLEINIEEEREDISKTVENQLSAIEEKYKNDILKLKMSNNNYDIFFRYAKDTVDQVRVRMKEVDRQGIFENDDEVGFMFKRVYDLSVDLAEFFERVEVQEIDEELLQNKLKS